MMPQNSNANTYDYVIVGAGSAGCVLANRLSANPAIRVLLLEAGGNDAHPYLRVPIGIGMLWKHRLFDWGFDSEPDAALHGRQLVLLRGKVLGGSSSVNAMAFTRGHPANYDHWSRHGAPGWSYAEVLPYFKRVETWEGGESEWRGGSGPIGVEFAKSSDPVFGALLAAGKAAGFPSTDDYNGIDAVGFGRSQYSISRGRRSSAAQGYLRPAMQRHNLTIQTGALAHRLLLAGHRAQGVEYSHHGSITRAFAEREVLLCAGAFNTPQILMLSGIGPATHLKEAGVVPVMDLPVGANLQDHLCVQTQWERTTPGIFHATMRLDRAAIGMARSYLLGTGPASILPAGLHAFLKTRTELAVPDIEFMFRAASLTAHPWFPVLIPAYQDGYQITAAILRPKSRGEVRLRSSDPSIPVRIDNRFLSHPADLPKLREALRLARKTGMQAPLDEFRAREISPGPSVRSDQEIDDWIRNNAQSVMHPVGTCRMGSDETAVVDPQLRVRGIEGLRVVDASAMPDIVSAHTNACVLMMAEKASDMITGKLQ